MARWGSSPTCAPTRTRVSEQALADVRAHIGERYGADPFVPGKPRYFRKKADAQDAHEAIRPTGMQYGPEAVRPHLTRDQYSLYRLIWNRFVASQMARQRFSTTRRWKSRRVTTCCGQKGRCQKFAGWLSLYPVGDPHRGRSDGVAVLR